MRYLNRRRASRSRQIDGLARLAPRCRAAAEEIHDRLATTRSEAAFIRRAARIIRRHMRAEVPEKGTAL